MTLTQEQQDAVDHRTSCLVKACPGSGKTRAIVAKLVKVCEEIKGTPRRVACITYTNAAVNELSHRVVAIGGLPANSCDITTIHTFCLQNILRPFSHLLKGEVSADFSILSPDSAELFEIGGEIFGGRINSFFLRENLMNLKRKAGGIFIPPNIDVEPATRFYREIGRRGLLTFGDIIFYSEKLVASHPFISRSLASRFYRIIVDEFQDTSPEQAQILLTIQAAERNHLFVVGDENQSIFSFNDARPDIFATFAEKSPIGMDVMTLNGNFRCSSRITASSEKICSRTPPMEAVGEFRDFPNEVTHVVGKTALDAITRLFLPAVKEANISLGNCAILAPQWYELRRLARQLGAQGIPVVGPGARPYRRASEFTGVAEAAAECVVSPSAEAALRMERALLFCLMSVNRGQEKVGSNWDRRKAMTMIKRHARESYDLDKNAYNWIRNLAKNSAESLSSLGLISEEGNSKILTTAEMMISQIEENHRNENPRAFTITDLSIFANPKDALEMSTLHSAKGREWEAVAMIDLHDNKIPHPAATDTSESQRLFYVGCSRAKKLLMLCSYSDGTPTRFLKLLK